VANAHRDSTSEITVSVNGDFASRSALGVDKFCRRGPTSSRRRRRRARSRGNRRLIGIRGTRCGPNYRYRKRNGHLNAIRYRTCEQQRTRGWGVSGRKSEAEVPSGGL